MLEAVAFTYTCLASFVLASTERNHRARRPNAFHLDLFARLLMALSLTSAALFGGWAVGARLIG